MILALSITLFLTVILVEVLNWGYFIKRALKKNEFDILKPFDCLPCTAFWLSIPLGMMFTANVEEFFIVITLSYILGRWMQRN